MILVNADKVKALQKKREMASRIRRPLATLAHLGGKTGRMAAHLDSYLSRKLDRNRGIYKELNP